MRKMILLATLLALFTFPMKLLWGQAAVAGKITGIVTDSSGAVVSGAVVTTTSIALLQPKVQQSSNSGVYQLEDLPPGEYQLSVSMPGFKGFRKKALF